MRKLKSFLVHTIVAILLVAAFSACASDKGTIRHGTTSVQSPENPGTPATLNTASQTGNLRIPKNSKIVRTEIAAQPARAATADTPAQPAQPAKVITEIEPSEPTEWIETKETINAGTGTIDTSVAKHKIDAQDRKWLLFAAIGCGILGIVVKSMLPSWPGLSNGLLIASPVAFAAWKMSEVPAWLWLAIIAIVGLLALGYKRSEMDKNKNGIPDFLEKKA